MATLTEEDVAKVLAYSKGLPRINIGAFMLPPIWGPAHGNWITILWYPIWLFADNTFYGAYSNPTTLSIIIAVVVAVSLAVATFIYALVGQSTAAQRAMDSDTPQEVFVKHERIWAVCSVIGGIILLAAATYYNLMIRPTLGI